MFKLKSQETLSVAPASLVYYNGGTYDWLTYKYWELEKECTYMVGVNVVFSSAPSYTALGTRLRESSISYGMFRGAGATAFQATFLIYPDSIIYITLPYQKKSLLTSMTLYLSELEKGF